MFKRNSNICLIECEMSALSIMKLSSIIDDIFLDRYAPQLDVRVDFYKYIGSSRSITKVYDENRYSQWPFEYNNREPSLRYFLDASIGDFNSSNNRVFLFEIHSFDLSSQYAASNYIDTINLEHICLLSRKLKTMGEDFHFFISGKPSGDLRYTCVTDSDFHRARTFLFLESIFDVCSRIHVLAQFCGKWVSFYSPDIIDRIKDFSQRTDVILNDTKFGKILPLITVNRESYMCFHKRAFPLTVNNSTGLLEKRLRELMECYVSRLQRLLSLDERKLLNEMLVLDNVFEAIVFLSTLYYFMGEETITTNEIEQLHENCIDYSQGIFQLIENSFYHVIKENELGWGNVALRIREKKQNSDSNYKYEYEIHLNDLSGLDNGPIGIVNSLICNFPELQDSGIQLRHLFNYSENEIYAAFLEDDVNIAHHYGLMILNNAVLSHNGIIHVRSADGVYLSDNPDLSHDRLLPWINGTSYSIKMPIMLDKPVFNRWDNIALDNPDLHGQKIRTSELITKNSLHLSTCYYSSQNKVNCINEVHEQLNKLHFDKDTIYVIDCSGINSETEYEVLAKSVFLLLSSPNDFVRVAFINLESKYSVIKIFRQFALFYNRKGENKTLSNKGVFFVDNEAKLPLLLLGHIVDIINEIYALELTGEIDETAATIINCLGRRVNGS